MQSGYIIQRGYTRYDFVFEVTYLKKKSEITTTLILMKFSEAISTTNTFYDSYKYSAHDRIVCFFLNASVSLVVSFSVHVCINSMALPRSAVRVSKTRQIYRPTVISQLARARVSRTTVGARAKSNRNKN